MKAHPLADIFPLIEGADFDALVADIRAHGLREPVVRFEGKILDGRNRYRASLAAGIFVGEAGGKLRNCVQFDPERDGDPLAFVLSKNLRRRHLSESQRGMIAACLATMRQGARTDLKLPANLPEVSQPRAAELLNVSERTVRDAVRVRDEGVPELARAVERGQLAVSAAAQAAKLEPDAQRAIAERAAAGEANVVRTAIKQGARAQREAALGAKQAALPDARFGVILADPEWRFEPWSRKSGLDRAADNHYPTSATDVIASRDVASIAADDCVLFLWATAPMLPHALLVMGAWGFDYKTHAVWAKDRNGTGYWFRNRHELLLVGARGSAPGPAMGTQWMSLLQAPAAEHSAKPEIFHELIEAYFPSLTKIELNRRGPARKGWAAWGNQVEAGPETPDVGAGPEDARARFQCGTARSDRRGFAGRRRGADAAGASRSHRPRRAQHPAAGAWPSRGGRQCAACGRAGSASVLPGRCGSHDMNRKARTKAQRVQFEALVRAGPKDGLGPRQTRSLARRATKVTLARVSSPPLQVVRGRDSAGPDAGGGAVTAIVPISTARLARPADPPDGGARPELRWVAIDELYVDQSYQRELGRRGLNNIARIAARFDWAFFAPVIVAPLDAGAFFVIIDGQHRTTAAKLIGKQEVPCCVVAADRAKQAAAFSAINGVVTQVSALNLHKAAIAARSADALAIESVASAAGARVCLYPLMQSKIEPDQTMAVGAIGASLREFGRPCTEIALTALVRANRRGLMTAPMIRGLAAWALEAEGARAEKLAALASIDLAAAELAAKRSASLDGGARWGHVVAAVQRRIAKKRAA